MLEIVIATKVAALFKWHMMKLINNYVLFNIYKVFLCDCQQHSSNHTRTES